MTSPRLRSLWDIMQRIHAGEIAMVASSIAAFTYGFESPAYRAQVVPQIAMSAGKIADFAEKTGYLHFLLVEAECPLSAERVEVLHSILAAYVLPAPMDTIVTLGVDDSRHLEVACSAMRGLIEQELASKFVFAVSPKDVSWAEPGNHFGDGVGAKFPSLVTEINEACLCLALDRTTVSAFHSIRCLEAGIRAICRCLGIDDPTKGTERSWGSIQNSLTDKMAELWPDAKAKMSDEYRMFDRVIAALKAFQNPYRNETMHLDAEYNSDEARHIMEMVKGFLGQVAKKCDEKGEPKI